jgi:hypothetical protein
MKTKAIQRWAFTHDVTWVMIAKEIGLSRKQVGNIIHNRRTDTGCAVRCALLWFGCPAKLVSVEGGK